MHDFSGHLTKSNMAHASTSISPNKGLKGAFQSRNFASASTSQDYPRGSIDREESLDNDTQLQNGLRGAFLDRQQSHISSFSEDNLSASSFDTISQPNLSSLQDGAVASGINDNWNQPSSIELQFLSGNHSIHRLSQLSNRQGSSNLQRAFEARTGGTMRRNIASNINNQDAFVETHAERIVSKMEQDETLMVNSPEAEELRRTALRDMPQSLTLKRRVKNKLSKSVSYKSKRKSLGVWRTLKYRLSMSWTKLKGDLKDLTYSFELWYGPLKRVEGNFGTGVASFFKFLRWLFLLNFCMCLISVGFIVIPKALYHSEYQKEGWEMSDIITGQGYLSNTLMYYGFYTNETIGSDILPYSMPHAYFFTMLSIYFVSFVVIGISAARAYRKSFIETEGGLKNVFASKIFCAWDYNIATKDAAELKCRSIYNELKELIGEFARQNRNKTFCDKFQIYATQFFMNFLVLCAIAGTGVGIWYFLHTGQSSRDFQIILVPAIINIIMTVMPMVLSLIVRYEDYKNPKISMCLTLFRTFLLGATCIGVLVTYWLQNYGESDCWETSLAQEFYRMIIFDFFISVACTALLDIVKYFIYKFFTKDTHLEFDIAWNTVQIIYNQTLFWVGLIFSPLLPVVVVTKLFLIWYIRYFIVIYLCKPSSKPLRAAHSSVWYLVMTFMSLLCVGGSIGYIISHTATSSNCGPFRNYKHIYELVTLGVLQLEANSTVWSMVLFVTKPGVIAIVLLFLCALVYYLRAKANAEREVVEQYRHMLSLSAKDKERYYQWLSKLSKGQWQYQSNDVFLNPELHPPRTSAGDTEMNPTDETRLGPSTSSGSFSGNPESAQYSQRKKYT